MANIIKEQLIIDSNKRTLAKYVFLGDGSAASNVAICRFSELRYAKNATGHVSNTNPKTDYSVRLKRIHGDCKANSHFVLHWNSNANTQIATFSSGPFDFNFESMGDGATIPSPDSANKSFTISAVNPGATDSFTLFLDIKKSGEDFDMGQTNDPVAFNRGPGAAF